VDINQENNLPDEVKAFVAAIRDNARKVWNRVEDPDSTDEENEEFVRTLLHITQLEDGSITVCDNYERFFSLVYRFQPRWKSWSVRSMYPSMSESEERPYTYDKCMGDASILYTG
jgi:hypothetical protein